MPDSTNDLNTTNDPPVVTTSDKNQAVISFLFTCPALASSSLFFNFINAKNDNKQLITLTNDISLHRPYIDGSVLKRYTFTLIDFKSISYNALVNLTGYSDENVDDMLEVQQIIDWITLQNDRRNYPNFGPDMQIEEMRALSDNPNLNGIDNSVQPALAKYSVSIQIDYVDSSKAIWRTT